MKALVSINANRVQLLGMGADEHVARAAAFEYVNRFNPSDEELSGSTLVSFSPELDALHSAAMWNDTYDEDGSIMGIGASDAHQHYMNALNSYLNIRDGLLSYSRNRWTGG